MRCVCSRVDQDYVGTVNSLKFHILAPVMKAMAINWIVLKSGIILRLVSAAATNSKVANKKLY